MNPMDLKTQLKREEGSIPYAYQDNLGFWTIGVGRLIDKSKGGRLRPIEIDFLLDNDIAEKTRQVDEALPWAKQLNEPRRAVLIGMCFQMGIGNTPTPRQAGSGLLGFVKTLASIRDGHYDHAADQMLVSKWAKQTPDRARRMSRQMATGEWN